MRNEGDQKANWRERTVSLTVDELDLDAEQQGRQPRQTERQAPEQQGEESFGLMLGNVTPEIAREVELPSDRRGAVVMQVDPNGPSAPRLRERDIILSVNGQRVSSAAEAGKRAAERGSRDATRRFSCGVKAKSCSSRFASNAMNVVDLVRERGRLTVAAFMDLALYEPQLGYYARASRRSGRAGDFFTSVDVGPLFGELLAEQIAEMAALLDGDRPATAVDLVEAGAGNGRLAADVLRALERRHPALFDRVRLHLSEASAAARAAHRAVAGRSRRQAGLFRLPAA